MNVRQALSPILAASAGVPIGAVTGTIAIEGGKAPVTKVSVSTDSADDRSSVSSRSRNDRSPTMATALTPSQFFAPTYFSPFYFPPLLVQAGGSGGVDVSLYRDRDAFAAILAALAATGEFADVIFGTSIDRMAAGADATPVVVVTPESWTELDDVDPSVIVRQVAYTLTIAVREEDPGCRYEKIDRLSSVVLNAIDGSTLGGGCLPGLTRVRRGRYEMGTKHPELRLVTGGEFTYLIPSLTGHDTLT